MISRTTCTALIAGLAFQGAAAAEDNDVAEGQKLYTAQCQICHGTVEAPTTGSGPQIFPLRLAMRENPGSTVTDVPVSAAAGLGYPQEERVAVALPFGPNLRGIVGRPAGTVPGYAYSATLMKTLKGMEWNEAALDVWITNPQAWVPGVFMYYKQRDPDVRRKIILYLKANS
jgi:cytochrome c2